MKSDKNVERRTLDALLQQRALDSSELPWLEMRVLGQVEWREQARQWLQAHPRGLGQVRQPLRERLGSAVCSLAAARVWPVVGIALAVACLLFVMTRMPQLAPLVQGLGQWGGISSAAAVLTVLAVALVNWPRLRQFYG
jgi:hypothetical protein